MPADALSNGHTSAAAADEKVGVSHAAVRAAESLLAETVAGIDPLCRASTTRAQDRLDRLTKPPGSLGRLEELAVQLAGISGTPAPVIARKAIYVFAADHGVTAEGVSAYPAVVTAQMVANFLKGGAAINVLARQVGADLVTVDMGTAYDVPLACGMPPAEHALEEQEVAAAERILLVRKIARGTRNFTREPAMTREQALCAVATGIDVFGDCQLAGIGEMGIGNSTSAAALLSLATGRPAVDVVGRGTGVDAAGLERKIDAVERAAQLHRPDPADGIALLAAVGGFEIGGMAGCMLAAAANRVPVVVDGFISTAAALVATRLCPALQPYLIAAHCSSERGHPLALDSLGLRPLLSLGMRLGECTGAALAFPLIEAASRLLREMATFAEAGVSERGADAQNGGAPCRN